MFPGKTNDDLIKLKSFLKGNNPVTLQTLTCDLFSYPCGSLITEMLKLQGGEENVALFLYNDKLPYSAAGMFSSVSKSFWEM